MPPDVLAALYQRPWRMLHISAHGVFALRHTDGRYRSGVLLSDGLLITAAEIAAMEVVPDVVFLNCCHLGTVDVGSPGQQARRQRRARADRHRRALRRRGRLGGRRRGRAALRRDLLRGAAAAPPPVRRGGVPGAPGGLAASRSDITWGAFQAYGDPAWRAEPRAPRRGSGRFGRPSRHPRNCSTSWRACAPSSRAAAHR